MFRNSTQTTLDVPYLSGPVRAVPARPGLRERNKQDKLARIKRTARRLFEKQGVEATTIRQIAAAADIGLGTVFSYAANKQDLLVMIFLEEVGKAVELALADTPATALLEQVLHIFDAIIAHHRENSGLARVFVKETPFIDDTRHGLHKFMGTLYAGLTAAIERAKNRGEVRRDVSSPMLARNLFGIFFQHMQNWLGGKHPQRELNYRRLRDSLELQLIGLRNTRAPRGRRRSGTAAKARRLKGKSDGGADRKRISKRT